ncbi:hypothetical protein DK875_03200 [Streptococcus suis]|nr:hypothetical protein DK875_03200 [Streptococcus suis]
MISNPKYFSDVILGILCSDNTKGGFFLPFVKFIKVFDEKYFVSRHPNKEIVFFWTKVTCKKEYTK